jgi:hypothetical protein
LSNNKVLFLNNIIKMESSKMNSPSEIQSILFDEDYWSDREAMKWLKDHHFKPIKLRKSRRFIHARLNEPSHYKRLRNKKVGNHIELIIGFI